MQEPHTPNDGCLFSHILFLSPGLVASSCLALSRRQHGEDVSKHCRLEAAALRGVRSAVMRSPPSAVRQSTAMKQPAPRRPAVVRRGAPRRSDKTAPALARIAAAGPRSRHAAPTPTKDRPTVQKCGRCMTAGNAWSVGSEAARKRYGCVMVKILQRGICGSLRVTNPREPAKQTQRGPNPYRKQGCTEVNDRSKCLRRNVLQY